MSDRLAQLWADANRAGWAGYIRNENDERALLDGCYVDTQCGQVVVDFFERLLCHCEGRWAGKSFVLSPWQRDGIIMPLFSWRRKDGRRRFRSADIWVPKKNGKSPLAAGLALQGIIADGEPGARVFLAANDREQASEVFNYAANMVNASPALSRVLQVLRSRKTIVFDHATWIRALSGEPKSSEGKNASRVVIDEIHVFDNRGRMLRESLRYAGRMRAQPLEIVISTAGSDLAGVGREQYEFAKNVEIGVIHDTSAFVYIREAAPADDWTDPAVWAKANPQLGISIELERMREECERAKQNPAERESFKRYCLNIWTAAASPWLDLEAWKACKATMPYDLSDFFGQRCCAAVDLSSTTDLSALILCRKVGEKYRLWPMFWLPADRLAECEARDRIRYGELERAGLLFLCPGRRIDYEVIDRTIGGLLPRVKIQQLGYDPWNAETFVQGLARKYGLRLIEIPQSGKSMSQPSKNFERLVATGGIEHSDHPILTWMASCTMIKTDSSGNIKVCKSDTAKRRKHVDGIIASIMAVKLESDRPSGPRILCERMS